MSAEPAGYLAVFDRRVTSAEDLASIEPFEPTPARFRTREDAERRKETYEAWDRKSPWSIFTDAIMPYMLVATEKGPLAQPNPDYVSAPFEVRIVSAEWLKRPDSFLEIAENRKMP